MTDNNDFRETETDTTDLGQQDPGSVSDSASDQNKDNNGFEEYCSMCRRPESKCGRLTHLPSNMNICQDCMQKVFDGMGKMNVFPGMDGINIGDLFQTPPGKGPNISFVNMSDLQGIFGNQQKVKQKKKKEKKQNS